MKKLKTISLLSLVATGIAIAIATVNLIQLYKHEKEITMQTVRECTDNAVVLEMVKRMERSGVTSQSFIRLNDYIEMAQQKNGRVSQADSVQISLANLMRFGLDFPEGKSNIDSAMLDSLFMLDSLLRMELNRHGLNPQFAAIKSIGVTPFPDLSGFWTIDYSIRPSSTAEYVVYVSPMPSTVLSRMWGIIIPFIAVILILTYLSAYLITTIRRMRTLEEMKDDFAHNMTHELKTPIAVAYSAADSLLRYYDQSDEARNKQFLNIILQRLSYLSGMIENILSMSMERFKTLKLNIGNVVLRPLAEDAAGLIKLKADKPVEIDIDIPETLTIRADELHLGNLLTNLIENAVKYSEETVKISITADAESITVSDNGIGIDKNYLPYIFDKFYRVPSGDRYAAGGYGLGLFYVKQIAGLMDWEISVESQPGYGTKFTIKFKDNEERVDITC